ncbi:hypothetical protein [Neobacillus sp. NPDC093127]|uniref:hypothetical protein n=1 Tax=Neobacillus sp. NPDC093127 TaxID=3364296 RepID=UPI003803753E
MKKLLIALSVVSFSVLPTFQVANADTGTNKLVTVSIKRELGNNTSLNINITGNYFISEINKQIDSTKSYKLEASGGKLILSENGVTLEGAPKQIKDIYKLIKGDLNNPNNLSAGGKIAYIDFKSDLAYIVTNDNKVKMLNIKTGEPVFENGEDKILSLDNTYMMKDNFVKVIPDKKNNYLYIITSKEAKVTDMQLNEISSTRLESYRFLVNEETQLNFYKYDEYE